MSEIIEKIKKNKAVAVGAAGALSAAGLFGYSEIHKETPTTPTRSTIEILNPKQNFTYKMDGTTVFLDAKPHELAVVRGEDGKLAVETAISGNPVEGSAVDAALEAYAENKQSR